MYTEAEAKEKTCPLSIAVAPVYHPLDGQGIRDGGPFACVGAECMAWRWVTTSSVHGAQNTERGYCGVAGHPYPAFVVPR